MRGSAGRRTGVGPLGSPCLDMSEMCEFGDWPVRLSPGPYTCFLRTCRSCHPRYLVTLVPGKYNTVSVQPNVFK